MKNKIIIAAICLLSSCQTVVDKTYTIQLTDQYLSEIPMAAAMPLTVYYSVDNDLYITYGSNEILKYDFELQQVDTIYTYPDYQINNISTFTINEYDNSLIVYSEEKNGFFRILGESISFHGLDNQMFRVTDNEKTRGFFISPTEMVLFLVMGDLSVFPSQMLNEDLTTFAIYDFEKNSISHFFGKYPSHLIDKKGMYPREFQTPYYIRLENELVISFPLSDDLQIIELNNLHKVNNKKISSSYFSLPPPFTDGNDRSEVFKLFYYGNKYGKISYHSDLDIFSRVVTHSLPLTETTACNRKYSIIFFNKEFKILDEVVVSDIYMADWSYILPTPSGFIVPGMCDNYLGEDYLIYNSKFKIVANDHE